jgi:hypothetical protein
MKLVVRETALGTIYPFRVEMRMSASLSQRPLGPLASDFLSSHFSLLSHLECVTYLDAEIAHGALQFCVAE